MKNLINVANTVKLRAGLNPTIETEEDINAIVSIISAF